MLFRSNDTLRAYMSEVLPDYDTDRVYPSDIRKLISWYNLLISKGITDFKTEEEGEKEEGAAKEKEVKAAPKKVARTENKVKVESKKSSVAQKKLTGVKKNG